MSNEVNDLMSNEVIVAILKKIPFFEGSEEATLSFFAKSAELLNFEEGEVIFKEGDVGERMYIILTGKVKIYRTGKDGAVKILSVLTNEDEIMGEMSLLDGHTRSASAKAMEDSMLFSLSRKDFQTFLHDNFPVAIKIIETLSLRLRAADESLTKEISPLV